MNEEIKKTIIKTIKEYFLDRLRATYQIRFSECKKSITLDEYYDKLKNSSATKEDSYNVRLNEEEINIMFSYLDKYFFCINMDLKDDFGNYFLEVFACANYYTNDYSKDKNLILKYMNCMIHLRDALINKEFEGKIHQSYSEIEVIDHLGNLFVKYEPKKNEKFITSSIPVMTIDKLYIVQEDDNDICVMDYGIYYYDSISCRMYSKEFDTIPLKDYLDSIGASFLICSYYKSEEEIKTMMSRLQDFKNYSSVKREYAVACANMFFNNIVSKVYSKKQKDIFIKIVSNEILQQLYLSNYALIHNEYPDSSIIDEACSESNIQLKDGAHALEISSADATVTHGYEAIKKIYQLTDNNKNKK